FAGAAPLRMRAELLDHRTAEYTLIGEFSEAIASGREALECWQRLGDRPEEGRALTALAWPLWVLGAHDEAESVAHRAIAVLKEGDAGAELIRAYLRLAILAHSSEAMDAAASWATRGLEVAEQLHDQASVIEARVQIA